MHWFEQFVVKTGRYFTGGPKCTGRTYLELLHPLINIWKIDRYLMRFTKDESEINLSSGEADPEFSEWKWASPEDVIEQVC